MMRMLSRSLLLTLALTTGCSGLSVLSVMRPSYNASVQVILPLEGTVLATRRALHALGWNATVSRTRSNRIVAMRDVTTASRDVAIVDIVAGGNFEIWVRTEIAGDDGHWISPLGVCDGYTYSREREIAARIEAAARRIERHATVTRRDSVRNDATARSQ